MAKKRRQQHKQVEGAAQSAPQVDTQRKPINTQDVINRAMVMATVDLHTPPGKDATHMYSRCMEAYNAAASPPQGTHARGMEAVRALLTHGNQPHVQSAHDMAASFQARRAAYRSPKAQ